jgi:hypothetical protein
MNCRATASKCYHYYIEICIFCSVRNNILVEGLLTASIFFVPAGTKYFILRA